MINHVTYSVGHTEWQSPSQRKSVIEILLLFLINWLQNLQYALHVRSIKTNMFCFWLFQLEFHFLVNWPVKTKNKNTNILVMLAWAQSMDLGECCTNDGCIVLADINWSCWVIDGFCEWYNYRVIISLKCSIVTLILFKVITHESYPKLVLLGTSCRFLDDSLRAG